MFKHVAGVGDVEMSPEEITAWEAQQSAPQPAPSPEMVDAERDRRIVAGFIFEGVQFQSRPEDRENIAGAKSLATDAVALGAVAGELDWRQRLNPTGPEVFAWIAADNSLVPMDAPTVIQFAYAAVDHKEAMIFAARAIKNLDPIPSDYTDDAYWP